jgi:tetratricopeptide (TPR) repeat protein
VKKIVYIFIVLFSWLLIQGLACSVARVDYSVWQEYLYWQRMVEKYPDGPISNFNLAMVMAYMGKVEEGSVLINKVAGIDPDIVSRLIKKYEKKLAADPENWRFDFRLGFIYYFDGNLYRAMGYFDKVAKHRPIAGKNAWAYGYIAVIKGEQNKWHRAEEACKKGLKIEPDGAALHAALAKAYYEQKKLVEASYELILANNLKKDYITYEKKMLKKLKAGK